jgi:hypothetical protein
VSAVSLKFVKVHVPPKRLFKAADISLVRGNTGMDAAGHYRHKKDTAGAGTSRPRNFADSEKYLTRARRTRIVADSS